VGEIEGVRHHVDRIRESRTSPLNFTRTHHTDEWYSTRRSPPQIVIGSPESLSKATTRPRFSPSGSFFCKQDRRREVADHADEFDSPIGHQNHHVGSDPTDDTAKAAFERIKTRSSRHQPRQTDEMGEPPGMDIEPGRLHDREIDVRKDPFGTWGKADHRHVVMAAKRPDQKCIPVDESVSLRDLNVAE
jgi:hypothetical protein